MAVAVGAEVNASHSTDLFSMMNKGKLFAHGRRSYGVGAFEGIAPFPGDGVIEWQYA